MKLHKDGTLEGTPLEMAEYNRLMLKRELALTLPQEVGKFKYKSPSDATNPLMPNPLQPSIMCGDVSSATTVQSDYWKNVQAWNTPDETTSIVEIQLEAQKNMKPWDRDIAKL